MSSPTRLGCLGTAVLGIIGSYAGGSLYAVLAYDHFDLRKASTFIGAVIGGRGPARLAGDHARNGTPWCTSSVRISNEGPRFAVAVGAPSVRRSRSVTSAAAILLFRQSLTATRRIVVAQATNAGLGQT